MRAWDCQSRASSQTCQYVQARTLIEPQSYPHMYIIQALHIRLSLRPVHRQELLHSTACMQIETAWEADMQPSGFPLLLTMSLHMILHRSKGEVAFPRKCTRRHNLSKSATLQDYTFIVHGICVQIHFMQGAPGSSLTERSSDI
jgi:hypothetical protein